MWEIVADTHKVTLDLRIADLAALDAFVRAIHETARGIEGIDLTGVLKQTL